MALLTVAVGYTAGILIWLGLWLTVGDRLWWLMLVHWAVPVLFIPVPLLAVAVVATRAPKWLWGVLTVPTLVFGGFYHTYLLPRRTQAVGPPAFSAMTYNILYSNRDYEAVADAILTYRPDFVALQEVELDAWGALKARLQDVYPHTFLGPARRYGTTAILSRYEIVSGRALDLEIDPSAVMVQARVAGADVAFVSAHLLAYGLRWVEWYEIPQYIERRTALQNRQAQLLLDALPDDADVVLLGCDCNANEVSTSYRILDAELTNAARSLNKAMDDPMPATTVPDRRLLRVDYIFYRGNVAPLGTYRIGDAGGSDHQPVFAQFAFADTVE